MAALLPASPARTKESAPVPLTSEYEKTTDHSSLGRDCLLRLVRREHCSATRYSPQMKDLNVSLSIVVWAAAMGVAAGADAPGPTLEKPGWKLTFHDEFDRPQLNDMYWFAVYRSGRMEYLDRLGHQEVRWLNWRSQVSHLFHYTLTAPRPRLPIAFRLGHTPMCFHRYSPAHSAPLPGTQPKDAPPSASTGEVQLRAPTATSLL